MKMTRMETEEEIISFVKKATDKFKEDIK